MVDSVNKKKMCSQDAKEKLTSLQQRMDRVKERVCSFFCEKSTKSLGNFFSEMLEFLVDLRTALKVSGEAFPYVGISGQRSFISTD